MTLKLRVSRPGALLAAGKRGAGGGAVAWPWTPTRVCSPMVLLPQDPFSHEGLGGLGLAPCFSSLLPRDVLFCIFKK